MGLVCAKGRALELIGFHHLAKAAEVLALHIIGGARDGGVRVRRTLETRFRRASDVCGYARPLRREPLSWALAATRIAGGLS